MLDKNKEQLPAPYYRFIIPRIYCLPKGKLSIAEFIIKEIKSQRLRTRNIIAAITIVIGALTIIQIARR